MRNNLPERLQQIEFSSRLQRLGLGESRLALGTAGLGGVWGPVDPAESVETILLALSHGINVLDTAAAYGTAEIVVGQALQQWTGPRPVVSTKVGKLPSDSPSSDYDFSSEGMRFSLRRSLDRLQVGQVDLLLLHEPEMVPADQRARVIDALCELKNAGLTRHLGLGGGYGSGWDIFVESGAFSVVMIHSRFDACCLEAFQSDIHRARTNGLAIYGASPLHNGLLGDRYDEFSTQAPSWLPRACLSAAGRVRRLADQYGLSLASLAHRFLYSAADVDRVVLGASRPSQLEAAVEDWRNGSLPEELFAAVCETILVETPTGSG